MTLTFLGTRGYIESRTQRHRMHTSLLVGYRQKRVMIDCGADWLDELPGVNPRAIVITHAHPDHVDGLQRGARCPVFATEETWERIADYPIQEKRTIEPRQPLDIEGMTFEAFPVEHSLRAPTMGYRVTAGRVSIFYSPDLVYIHDRSEALSGVRLYIGDGATVERSFVRRRGDALFGHAPVRTQLTWCSKEGVPEAVITHCGSEIVDGDERTINARLNEMGRQRGLRVTLAYDGRRIVLR